MAIVLVTGGAGFIGSHLIEKLLKEGHEVICFDDLSTGIEKNIAPFKNKIKFIKGDANTNDLDKVFKENSLDWVYHYAAVVGVKRTVENPLKVLKDIDGIRKILDLSRKYNVKKLIYSSSSEVYGEAAHLPTKEDSFLNAAQPYALVKLFGENYLKAYYKEFGLKTCSLRFFNVYGPRQESTPYGFVTGIFIRQVLNNQGPTVFGDGSHTRDFVYIDDNIDAAIKVATSNKVNGEVINIGTGIKTSIKQLAETIIKLSGKNLKPVFLESKPFYIEHRHPDVAKMLNLLEFKPKHTLEEGLKKTFEWYKNNI